MTAGTWFADVSFIAATAISDEHLDEIIDALAPHGGAVSLSPDTNAGTISVAFDADDVMDASRIATTIAEDTIGRFSTIDVIKLDVRDEAEMEKEINTPAIPDLVGYAEIAEMAGVSRQRARQFSKIAGFPVAVVETAAGPLRLRASIEAWLRNRNTKPGRPRVHATA